MFRKPKRKVPGGLRKKEEDEETLDRNGESSSAPIDEDDDDDTRALLSEARKRVKDSFSTGTNSNTVIEPGNSVEKKVMHSFTSQSEKKEAIDGNSSQQHKDLAASSNAYHTESGSSTSGTASGKAEKGADGIFRDATRNKFHAGPLRAATNVRMTARFDYQPDICKDYKETGFCGFGDTCIYLHDRGDFLTGWQLEQKWEEEQRKKKDLQEKEIDAFLDNSRQEEKTTILTDDGLPFACYLCRSHFTDPVITSCSHFFCQQCIMNYVRETSEHCPVCNKDTHSVFNEPSKLIAKKRRVLGISQANMKDSWEQFFNAMSGRPILKNDG
jgi:RING finger protein 113A